MTMMKKKSQEAIDILNTIVLNKKCEEMRILSLLYKYLGYGYFKISEYAKSIKYYQKVTSSEIDESSQYNKLLAEGI
jgi:tetratricopeptide (TPR) repeat protein